MPKPPADARPAEGGKKPLVPMARGFFAFMVGMSAVMVYADVAVWLRLVVA